MKDRIKQIRKARDLTQQKLADRLGIQRNTIAMYEMGKTTPSEAIILSICRELNVSEPWLRYGIGEMFVEQTRDEQIEEFIGKLLQNEDDSFKRRLVSGLAALDDTGWNVLESFLDSIQKKGD